MPRNAPAIVLDTATRATLNGWVQAATTPQVLALRSRIMAQSVSLNSRTLLGTASLQDRSLKPLGQLSLFLS